MLTHLVKLKFLRNEINGLLLFCIDVGTYLRHITRVNVRALECKYAQTRTNFYSR